MCLPLGDRFFCTLSFFSPSHAAGATAMLGIWTAAQAFFMLLGRRRAGPEPPYFFPEGQGRLLRSQYLLENSPYSFLTVNDVSLVIV
jgi:hypothetical protein